MGLDIDKVKLLDGLRDHNLKRHFDEHRRLQEKVYHKTGPEAYEDAAKKFWPIVCTPTVPIPETALTGADGASIDEIDPVEFKGKDKPTFREEVEWAFENRAVPDGDELTPAPSIGAKDLRREARKDRRVYYFVLDAKKALLPTKAEIERSERKGDDGQKLFGLLKEIWELRVKVSSGDSGAGAVLHRSGTEGSGLESEVS